MRRKRHAAVLRAGTVLLKLLLIISLAKAAIAHPLFGHAVHAASKKVAADLTKVLPTYPTAPDYASGVCAGYAFCFANWNPPVLTEPDVLCPSGYEVTEQSGKPFCVQKLGLCPSGYDLSSSGQCCTVKAQSQCYPTWDSCSAAGGTFSDSDVGSICQGSPEYKTLINHIDMVEVTPSNGLGSSSWPQLQQGITTTPSLPSYNGMTTVGGSGSYSIGSTLPSADSLSSSSSSSGGGVINLGGGSSIGGSINLSGSGSSIVGGQVVDGNVVLGSGNNMVGAGAGVGLVDPGSSSPVIINDGTSTGAVGGGSSMLGGGSSGGSSGGGVPTVIPSRGNAVLPPGAIVIDDDNGAANSNIMPVVSVDSPTTSPGSNMMPAGPPPIIIQIDNTGATRVNGAPAAGGNPMIVNGGSSINNNKQASWGSNGQVVDSSGMSNPTVIPSGSVINLNGRLVRVGGGGSSSSGSGISLGGGGGSNNNGGGGGSDWEEPAVGTGQDDDVVQPTNGGGTAVVGGGGDDGGSSGVVDDATSSAGEPQQDNTPAGNLVDLGDGQLGQTQPDVAAPSTGNVQPKPRPMTPQQQQALADLQRQADAAGTFIWPPKAGQTTTTTTTTGGSSAAKPPLVRPGAPGVTSTNGGGGDDDGSAAAAGDDGGAGSADGSSGTTQEQGGGGGTAAEDEWEQPASDTQESGRVLVAQQSIPIFDELTYETSSGNGRKQQQQHAKPAAARKSPAGQYLQQQQHQPAAASKKKSIQPQYSHQQQQHAQHKLRQSNMRIAGIDAAGVSSFGSSSSSSGGSSVGVAAIAPAVLPPQPGPGVMLAKMLLLLPKLEIAKLTLITQAGKMALEKLGGNLVAKELLATKEVLAALHTTKENLLPKCFHKCCTNDADVVCVDSKQSINYAKPQLVCPSGCQLNAAIGKCVCRPGNFSPCLPTDTVCSWGDQPICVGSSEFFGIPACTFVGALQKHLPRVQCPY